MPRYAIPPDMPPEVEAIIDVIGNRAREAIVRHLALHGPAPTVTLQDVAGTGRAATVRHLRTLEAAGLVRADIPAEHRSGHTPTWHLNRAELERHLAALRSYLLGE